MDKKINTNVNLLKITIDFLSPTFIDKLKLIKNKALQKNIQNELKKLSTLVITNPVKVTCFIFIPHLQIIVCSSNKEIYLFNIFKPSKPIICMNAHENNVSCFTYMDNYNLEKNINEKPNKFKCFLSGSWDGTIKLWDTNGKFLKIYKKAHNDYILVVQCLKNLEYPGFVSGGKDRIIKLWNLNEDQCIQKFDIKHDDSIWSLVQLRKFAVISGSADKTIQVWNAKNGKCLATLKGHQNSVRCIAVIDNVTIASAGNDHVIKIWNVEKQTCETTLIGHTKQVLCLIYEEIFENNNQVKLLISGSADKLIKIWDVSIGICRSTLEFHKDWINCLAFDKTKNILMSGSDDKTIKFWKI